MPDKILSDDEFANAMMDAIAKAQRPRLAGEALVDAAAALRTDDGTSVADMVESICVALRTESGADLADVIEQSTIRLVCALDRLTAVIAGNSRR